MRLSHLIRFPYLHEPLRRVVILCHRHADVDAYCSSYATASLLKQLYPSCRVESASPQGFSALAKRVQEAYRMKVVEDPDLRKVDLVVVVDTGHALLLEDWVERVKASKAVKIFIDHHPPSKSIEDLADHVILDGKASSTCEIVYKIFEAKTVKLTKRTAQILMIGILCDSQHLSITGCHTLSVVNQLCTLGASLSKARKILSLRREASENIARLKAAQRSKIYRAGRWIIAATTVGSFHASSARALIDLGAHISLALGEGDEGVRGSLRATQEFCTEAGVHLGVDIAEKVAEIFKGVGGGHAGAASFTGIASSRDVYEVVLKLLGEKLQVEFQELT